MPRPQLQDETNRRDQQRQETSKKLLEVSLRLFVLRGYAGTTVRDIARAARVSPGLMFHYFDSKQAILEDHAKAVEAGMSAMVRILRSSNQPLESFRIVAKTVLDSFQREDSKNLFLLANQILTVESIPRSVKKIVNASRCIDASVPLIAAGQHCREIRSGDPQAMAVAFWGALQGIAEVLIWNPRASIPNEDMLLRILMK